MTHKQQCVGTLNEGVEDVLVLQARIADLEQALSEMRSEQFLLKKRDTERETYVLVLTGQLENRKKAVAYLQSTIFQDLVSLRRHAGSLEQQSPRGSPVVGLGRRKSSHALIATSDGSPGRPPSSSDVSRLGVGSDFSYLDAFRFLQELGIPLAPEADLHGASPSHLHLSPNKRASESTVEGMLEQRLATAIVQRNVLEAAYVEMKRTKESAEVHFAGRLRSMEEEVANQTNAAAKEAAERNELRQAAHAEELDARDRRVQEVLKELAELEREHSDSVARVTELEDTIQAAGSAQVAAMAAAKRELAVKTAQVQRQTSRIQSLEEDAERLAGELAEKSAQLEEATYQRDDFSMKCTRLEEELEPLRIASAQLVDAKRANGQLKDVAAAAQKQISDLTLLLEEIGGELATKTLALQESDAFRLEQESAQAKFEAETNMLRSAVEERDEDIAILELQVNALKVKLADCEARVAVAAAADSEVAHLAEGDEEAPHHQRRRSSRRRSSYVSRATVGTDGALARSSSTLGSMSLHATSPRAESQPASPMLPATNFGDSTAVTSHAGTPQLRAGRRGSRRASTASGSATSPKQGGGRRKSTSRRRSVLTDSSSRPASAVGQRRRSSVAAGGVLGGSASFAKRPPPPVPAASNPQRKESSFPGLESADEDASPILSIKEPVEKSASILLISAARSLGSRPSSAASARSARVERLHCGTQTTPHNLSKPFSSPRNRIPTDSQPLSFSSGSNHPSNETNAAGREHVVGFATDAIVELLEAGSRGPDAGSIGVDAVSEAGFSASRDPLETPPLESRLPLFQTARPVVVPSSHVGVQASLITLSMLDDAIHIARRSGYSQGLADGVKQHDVGQSSHEPPSLETADTLGEQSSLTVLTTPPKPNPIASRVGYTSGSPVGFQGYHHDSSVVFSPNTSSNIVVVDHAPGMPPRPSSAMATVNRALGSPTPCVLSYGSSTTAWDGTASSNDVPVLLRPHSAVLPMHRAKGGVVEMSRKARELVAALSVDGWNGGREEHAPPPHISSRPAPKTPVEVVYDGPVSNQVISRPGSAEGFKAPIRQRNRHHTPASRPLIRGISSTAHSRVPLLWESASSPDYDPTRNVLGMTSKEARAAATETKMRTKRPALAGKWV